MIPVSGAALVALVGWMVRPKPVPRSTSRRKTQPRRWTAAAAVGVVAATSLMSPVIGVVSLIGVVTWRCYMPARRRTRAVRQIEADYPDALDVLVLSIRAGYLPAQAVVETTQYLPASLRHSFASVGQAMHGGDRFADALSELSVQLGPIAQPLVDSLASAERYGLPLAPVLERLAFEARQQRRRQSDASARELPVRLAMPLVLCTLPSFVLLAIVPLLLGALSSLRT